MRIVSTTIVNLKESPFTILHNYFKNWTWLTRCSINLTKCSSKKENLTLDKLIQIHPKYLNSVKTILAIGMGTELHKEAKAPAHWRKWACHDRTMANGESRKTQPLAFYSSCLLCSRAIPPNLISIFGVQEARANCHELWKT